MSEVDVHTLGYIQEHPGILATDCGDDLPPKGTVSLSLSKLEEQRDFWSSVSTRKRNLSAICT